VVAFARQVAAVEPQARRVEHGVVRRGDELRHRPAGDVHRSPGKDDVEALADVVLARPSAVRGRAHELADGDVVGCEQGADGGCGGHASSIAAAAMRAGMKLRNRGGSPATAGVSDGR
jgi:hypothetical protein